MVPFSSTLGLFQEVTHIAVLGRKESSSSFKEDPIAPEGRAVPTQHGRQVSLHCIATGAEKTGLTSSLRGFFQAFTERRFVFWLLATTSLCQTSLFVHSLLSFVPTRSALQASLSFQKSLSRVNPQDCLKMKPFSLLKG